MRRPRRIRDLQGLIASFRRSKNPKPKQWQQPLLLLAARGSASPLKPPLLLPLQHSQCACACERGERDGGGGGGHAAGALPPRPPTPPRAPRRRRRRHAAAARPRRAARGVRRGVHADVRRRQPRRPPRRPPRPPHPRRVHRRRVRLPGRLPPRLLQRRRQAPRRLRRRRRRRLLPVERRHVREDPRRGGLRVPRQRARARVARADERVRQWQHGRRQGGALRPPLRPHRRAPPLLHPLDSPPHHILRGRDADQGGGEDGGDGGGVPGEADVGVRHHLGRLGVGHARRALQGELQVRAVRRRVRRPRPPRLRRRPARRRTLRVVRGRGGGGGRGRVVRGDGGVPAWPHVLLLLPRPPEVPGRAVRVRTHRRWRRRFPRPPVRPRRDEAPPRSPRPRRLVVAARRMSRGGAVQ